MDRNFKRIVKNVVAVRIDSICLEVKSKDKKYIRLNGRSKRLQTDLLSILYMLL
jgi:hypothetical protein